MEQKPKYITVDELAYVLAVSKASLYYDSLLPEKDARLRDKVLEVINDNQTYGHKRVALELRINKKSYTCFDKIPDSRKHD